MGAMVSLITSLTSVYSTVHPDADQRKHQSSASLAFLWGIHRRPVNSPHKWPVNRKMFPFDDVTMTSSENSSPPYHVIHCRFGFYRGVLSSRSGRAGGRAGGCQTCGTHISVTAWWIFSIRSSVELSRPVGVHCHGHMPICPIWACPWAKNLSNLPQIGSRLCGTHISETAGWIYPI